MGAHTPPPRKIETSMFPEMLFPHSESICDQHFFKLQMTDFGKKKKERERETCARCSTSKPPLPPDATSLAGLTTTRLLGEVVQPYAKT